MCVCVWISVKSQAQVKLIQTNYDKQKGNEV